MGGPGWAGDDGACQGGIGHAPLLKQQSSFRSGPSPRGCWEAAGFTFSPSSHSCWTRFIPKP